MIFSPGIKFLFLHTGILQALQSNGGLPSAMSISIHGSNQPAYSDDLIYDWEYYNSTSTEFIALYNNVTWQSDSNGAVVIDTFPTESDSVTVNSGYAQWCVLWAGRPNLTISDLGEVDFPSVNEVAVPVLIGPVSSLSGDRDGIVRFSNRNFTAGEYNPINSGLISSFAR